MTTATASAGPPATIIVTEVIEGQKINAFVIRLVLLSWAVTFLDGFDMLVISFVAPYLRDGFGADAVSLGELFSVEIGRAHV